VGEVVAGKVDFTGEVGRAAEEDVDVGLVGPDVEQRDRAVGILLVEGAAARELESVADREGVDVDDRRLQAQAVEQADVVLDQRALHGYEQHAHLVLRRLDQVIVRQRLAVHDDILDVEGDVLVRFVADGVAQVLLRHARHGQVAHDHGLAVDRGHHALRVEGVFAQHLEDRVRTLLLAQDFRLPVTGHDEAVALSGQLDRFDRARPDVQANEGFDPSPEHVLRP
jgi:hypothetical protein